MSNNAIHSVPPEVWEIIAEYIHSSKDLVNFSKAFLAFSSAIYTKRVEWLCYQVLPVLVTNTYSNSFDRFQKDFLNCRLVCRHWKFAVDNFLENNVLHYPASGDDIDWKLNRCHNGQLFYLHRTETIFRQFNKAKLEKMLNEASNHPDNPIIGRYVSLHVPEQENREGVNLVEQFVETFGQHIYFLKIHFAGKISPTLFITILLGLLQNLPNLKGLDISKHTNFTEKDTKQISLEKWNRELNEIKLNTFSTETFRSNCPKLDTLNLEIEGLAGDILKQIIIDIVGPEGLKSLSLKNFISEEGSMLELPNLLHLSLEIGNNDQYKLQSVLTLNCPILRKLDLSKVMFSDLDYDLWAKVLQKFQSSVNHLSLNVQDLWEIKDGENRKKMITFFTTAGILQMPKIKSLSLYGWCPPSLNFVCGGGFGSLEYLNLYCEHEIEDDTPSFYSSEHESTISEITDVIQRLSLLWNKGCWLKKPEMYRSNIWNVLPKLKVIFIDSYWEPLNLRRWTYRRNDLLTY